MNIEAAPFVPAGSRQPSVSNLSNFHANAPVFIPTGNILQNVAPLYAPPLKYEGHQPRRSLNRNAFPFVGRLGAQFNSSQDDQQMFMPKPILPPLRLDNETFENPSPLQLPTPAALSRSPAMTARTTTAFTAQGLPNSKAKKCTVKLPDGKITRVALDFNFLIIDNESDSRDFMPEIQSRLSHFDEIRPDNGHLSLPPTIEIYLPGQQGWIDVLEALIATGPQRISPGAAMRDLPPDQLADRLNSLLTATWPAAPFVPQAQFLKPTSPLQTAGGFWPLSPISPQLQNLSPVSPLPKPTLNPAAPVFTFQPKIVFDGSENAQVNKPRPAKDLTVKELRVGLGIGSMPSTAANSPPPMFGKLEKEGKQAEQRQLSITHSATETDGEAEETPFRYDRTPSNASFNTDIIRNAANGQIQDEEKYNRPNEPDNWLQGVEEAAQIGKLEAVTEHAHLKSFGGPELNDIALDDTTPVTAAINFRHQHSDSAASSALNARAAEFQPHARVASLDSDIQQQEPKTDPKHQVEAYKMRMHEFKFPPPALQRDIGHAAFDRAAPAAALAMARSRASTVYSAGDSERAHAHLEGDLSKFSAQIDLKMSNTWENANRRSQGWKAKPSLSHLPQRESTDDIAIPTLTRRSTKAILRDPSEQSLPASPTAASENALSPIRLLAEFKTVLERGLGELRDDFTNFKELRSEVEELKRDAVFDALSERLQQQISETFVNTIEKHVAEILPTQSQEQQAAIIEPDGARICEARDRSVDLDKERHANARPLTIEELREVMQIQSEAFQSVLEQSSSAMTKELTTSVDAILDDKSMAFKGNCATVEKALSNIISSLSDAKGHREATTNALAETNVHISQQTAELQDLSASSAKLQALIETMASRQESQVELLREIQTTNEKAASLQSALDDMRQRLEVSERAQAAHLQDLSTRDAEFTKLQMHIRHLEEQARKEKLDLSKVHQAELAQKEKEIQRLRDGQAGGETQRTLLEEKLHSKEKENAHLLSNLAQSRASEKRLHEADASEKRLRETMDDLEADLIDMKVEVARETQDLKTRLTLATEKGTNLEQENKVLQKRLQLMETHVQRARQFDIVTSDDMDDSLDTSTFPQIWLSDAKNNVNINHPADFSFSSATSTNSVRTPIKADDGWWSL